MIRMTMNVREISEGEFAENCRELLDEVAATGEEIVVTRDGAPVARVLPPAAGNGDRDIRPESHPRLQKRASVRELLLASAQPNYVEESNPLKGSILWQGDIVSPVGEEDWDLLP